MSDFPENIEKKSFKLESVRSSLREVDDEMMRLIMKRMQIVKDIGSLKKQLGLQIFDRNREDFNKQRNLQIANGTLSAQRVEQLTDFLAEWAREIQTQMR